MLTKEYLFQGTPPIFAILTFSVHVRHFYPNSGQYLLIKMRIYFNQQSAQYSVYYLGWNLTQQHLRLLLPKSDHRILLCCSSAIIIIIQQLAHCKWRSADSKWIQQGSPHRYHFCICEEDICHFVLHRSWPNAKVFCKCASLLLQHNIQFIMDWVGKTKVNSAGIALTSVSAHTPRLPHIWGKRPALDLLGSRAGCQSASGGSRTPRLVRTTVRPKPTSHHQKTPNKSHRRSCWSLPRLIASR